MRQHVVRLRQTGCDQLVPHALWKRYVHEGFTVDVTDLSPPQTILTAPEAMGVGRHA
jgi:hypothetical protein